MATRRHHRRWYADNPARCLAAFGALIGVTPGEFRGHLWQQKIRVPGVSCGVVCVILRFAVSVEHRLVTDRQTQTDTGLWLVLRMHSIAQKKLFLACEKSLG